jgi:hypothetical protein
MHVCCIGQNQPGCRCTVCPARFALRRHNFTRLGRRHDGEPRRRTRLEAQGARPGALGSARLAHTKQC